MVGPEGTVEELVKLQLMEHFKIDWFQLEDLTMADIRKGLVIIETRAEREEEDRINMEKSRQNPNQEGNQGGAGRRSIIENLRAGGIEV